MYAIVAEFYRVLPILLFFVAFAIAVVNRSKYWLFFVIGMIFSAAISLLLKNFFDRYPSIAYRPNNINCGYLNTGGPAMSGGFPSGHAQTMGYMTAWFILSAWYFDLPIGIFFIIVVMCTLSIWLTILSRVEHARCHTLLQTEIGTVVGLLVAVPVWLVYVVNVYS